MGKVAKMGARKKVMNADELEKWLLNRGAVPVNEETKEKPWYKEVSKLPSCMRKEESQHSQPN